MGSLVLACLNGMCTPVTGEPDPAARGRTSQVVVPFILQSPVLASAWLTGPVPPRRRDAGVHVRGGTWGSERDSGLPRVAQLGPDCTPETKRSTVPPCPCSGSRVCPSPLTSHPSSPWCPSCPGPGKNAAPEGGKEGVLPGPRPSPGSPGLLALTQQRPLHSLAGMGLSQQGTGC